MEEEIRELNLTYLMLARRLLARDRDTAMFQMQLSEELADLLLELPAAKLLKLADVNQFLFRLRFSEGEQLERLASSKNDMEQIHTSLVLSSTQTGAASPC